MAVQEHIWGDACLFYRFLPLLIATRLALSVVCNWFQTNTFIALILQTLFDLVRFDLFDLALMTSARWCQQLLLTRLASSIESSDPNLTRTWPSLAFFFTRETTLRFNCGDAFTPPSFYNQDHTFSGTVSIFSVFSDLGEWATTLLSFPSFKS